MNSERIQVLIADDQAAFRRGLRALLHSAPDIAIVGEATSGEETIKVAEQVQPDVILMDLHMPPLGGLEATRRIIHSSPHIRIIVLTMSDDDEYVFAALQAGARGYLLKGALKDELLRAIRGVYHGEAIFSPAVAQWLMSYFANVRPTAPAYAFPELTEREREILTLIAQHRTNQEIADLLILSEKTVRNHVSNIFTKLQVADRAQAILRARDAGI
jgi:DNA-binding NarL/FixJ family response regulator